MCEYLGVLAGFDEKRKLCPLDETLSFLVTEGTWGRFYIDSLKYYSQTVAAG